MKRKWRFLIPKSKADKKLEELERQKEENIELKLQDKGESNSSAYSTSDDDVVVQEHIVKDQPYTLF